MSQIPFRIVPRAVPDAPDRLDILRVAELVLFACVFAAVGALVGAWLCL